MATKKRRTPKRAPARTAKTYTEAEIRDAVKQQRELTRLLKERADLDLKIVEQQAKLAMTRQPFAFSIGPCLLE